MSICRSAQAALAHDVPGVWRGSDLPTQSGAVVGTGWAGLDTELPGGGWPTRSITEILSPQQSLLEWRLLGAAFRTVVASGRQVVLVGPPKQPHLPGLMHEGLDERHLIWIRAETPAERLWTAEQLVKAGAAGAIAAWLPQARQEQIRRLQVFAQSSESPVFLFRPEAARHEASAAPLRLHARVHADWALEVEVFKRRGALQLTGVRLPSIPGGLAGVLPSRLKAPSRLFARPLETKHVVGSLASSRRHAPTLQ